MCRYLESRRTNAGHQVVRFRLDALTLLLIPLPVLALWLWEGGLFNLQNSPWINGNSQFTVVIVAHRITGWLIPITVGAIFTYGIARTEPDVRLAVMGIYDPRRICLWRWLPVAVLFVAAASIIAITVGTWSGESLPRLVQTTLAATLFALALGLAVVNMTGVAPGTAAFTVAVLVAAAAFIPPLCGAPIVYSLAPGPLGWLRQAPYQWVFVLHDLVVVALAAAIVFIATLSPRDARDVRWISNYRGQDA